MPEPAPITHDTTDLERQVGDLLEEMQTATERLADEVKAPQANPAEPVAAITPEANAVVDAELATAVAALAEPLAAPQTPKPLEAPVAETPAEAAPGSEAKPDLASAVEKLLEGAAPAASAVPAPEGAGNVQTLDAKLAGLADELIAGEFEDEAAVMSDEVAAAAPAAPTTPTPEPAPSPVVAAAPIAAAPPPPPREEPARPMPKEPADVAPAVAAIVVPQRGLMAGSLAQKVLAAASGPLSGRPHLRDILGWVALVQAFMAMCVWVYVLFVRSDLPVDPPPVTAAAEHSKADEGHAGGHEKKTGHEAPKATKATKAKKPAKKPAQASSGGGHH